MIKEKLILRPIEPLIYYFGISGNLLGCGLTIASGIGVEIVKRKSKVKFPNEIRKLGEHITDSIRPGIHKLLAKTLNLDIRAIQLWDIREKLNT